MQVLTPQIDTLTEKQIVDVCNLRLSSQQAEDALSQGMDKLQQTLAETMASGPFVPSGVNYMGQMMMIAMGKLEALISFVNQVIHHLYSVITAIVTNLILGKLLYWKRFWRIFSVWGFPRIYLKLADIT